MDTNGEGGSENLAALLESLGLQSYHDAIRNELKVETVQQLKQVKEQDLVDIRMKPDDIQKLRKNIKMEFSQSAFGKLKKRLTRSSSESAAIRNSRSSIMSSDADAPQSPVPIVGRRIIARDQITIQHDIGEGEFGVVRLAVYANDVGQKIEVAVKSLSQDRLEHGLQEFLKEATSMQSVSHSNIVTFYGIVFQQDKELMLVTEYAPLKSLLECLHNESLRSILSVSRLCSFAHQIATGMSYLETQGLIHRDLAARNILVFSHHKVKIGDFGLSRALGLDKEYYQSKYRTDLKIPIAWCAPECINLLRFSSASDVWAFGVTMWEMFTFGKKPWEGLTSMEILKTIDSPKSERLVRPDFCPTEHYALMLKCWSHDPEDRPKFASITSELTSIKPTLMKAIRPSTSAPGVVEFNKGDTITVIDKKPADAPTWQYWMGVNKSGERGYFNPTDCVPVQPESSPLPHRHKNQQPPPKKTIKKQSGPSKSPKSQEKKRFTADMIGKPQDDLRHTGHIGYDGITFGDISFIGPEPVEKILPIKGTGSGSSTLKSSNSQGSGSTPSPVLNGVDTTDQPLEKPAEDRRDGGGDLEELSDFQFPDLSLTESLSFGTSFIDDMMKEFKTTDRYANTNENNNSSKQMKNGSSASHVRDDALLGTGIAGSSSACTSAVHSDALTNNGLGLSPPANNSLSQSTPQASASSEHRHGDTSRSRKKSTNKNKLVLPGTSLKSMSAADEKMINDAIELANQLASTSLSQANTPKDFEDTPDTPSKSKHRFQFKFPSTKKTSPKAEKKTFSDDLASKAQDCSATVTPEAEQAYNMLVAKGSNGRSSRVLSEDAQRHSRGNITQRPPEHPSGVVRMRRHSSNSQASNRTSRSSKGAERPKERPPLPPIQLAGNTHSTEYHDDLTNMPSTPPPPVPQSPCSLSTPTVEPVYNNMEAFWQTDFANPNDSGHDMVSQGRYKSRSDNVSYEDLAEINEERQQIRQMQKILGKEASESECRAALERTDGQVQSAVKYIKLKQLVNLRLAGVEQCKTALMCSQWSVRRATDYILDRKNTYENDVVGV